MARESTYNNLDQRSLEASQRLNAEKQTARNERMKSSVEKEESNVSDDNLDDISSSDMGSKEMVHKIKKNKNKKNISARKMKLAGSIKRKIKKERFDGPVFFATVVLALIKDITDIASAGTSGPVTAFVINPLLTILLWIGGSSRLEMKLKRIVIVNTLEIIPFLSLIPFWSLAVFKIKMEQDNEVRRLSRKLRLIEQI